jgi:hypothetical protein
VNSIDDCEVVNGHLAPGSFLVSNPLIASNFSRSTAGRLLRKHPRGSKFVKTGAVGTIIRRTGSGGIDTLTTNKKSALQGNALCTAAFLDERPQRRKLRINHRLLQPAA